MIKKKNPMIKRAKEKGCSLCKGKLEFTWKDYEKFGEFLSPRSRILPSVQSGVCVKHQRKLARVVKQARHLALIPFTTQE